MDDIYLALFEGALLFEAGIPVRDMYEHILRAYDDDKAIVDLFSELKSDWDSSSSPHALKMVGPFIGREDGNSEFKICRWFTEVAAATSMVDTFWKSCGYAYVLRKVLNLGDPHPVDMKLAREIFTFFEPSHPIMAFLFSQSKDPKWTLEHFQENQETMTFAEWAEVRLIKGPIARLRCVSVVEESAERMAYPELVQKIKNEWDIFSASLGAKKR